MQKIQSSKSPMVIGVCDPNKSRARHRPSLKLGSKLKYLNKNTAKSNRRLKELDYCLPKAELNLQHLFKCDESDVILNFLNFRLTNSHLKYSSTYGLCQSNLLG